MAEKNKPDFSEQPEDMSKRRKEDKKKEKIKLTKWYFIVPFVLLIFVFCDFAFWFIKPASTLSVAVLDKTVPATAADTASYFGDVTNNYRKHIGLYWLLDYMKIKNPETKKYYDYHTDYYGTFVNDANEITGEKSLSEINDIPDLVYLSDAYGTEITNDRGVTADEMNAVSRCHTAGSVVIGEQDIFNTGTSDEVAVQLQSLFGISRTGWVGRYFFDLADLSDVPYWAPDMYYAKYGQEWQCSGPGILLVSSAGNIIVMEEKTDFDTKNLLKISVADGYKNEFFSESLNFYNWFELIEAQNGTESIAQYKFNVNKTGAEKMAEVSDTTTFAAVTRKSSDDEAAAYYFAGDFNDYVTRKQISCFGFADRLFALLSPERDGDVTHFYWNFYVPLMKNIINDIKANPVSGSSSSGEAQTEQNFRITANSVQQLTDGTWKDIDIKGFNINGDSPGCDINEYSRDYGTYVSLIQSLGNMNANTVRAYDVLPPEFYRALFEYNMSAENPVYLIQGVKMPDDIAPADLTNQSDAIDSCLDSAVTAVHGGGTIPASGSRISATYGYDLSKYLIAYIINPGFDSSGASQFYEANSGYTYAGNYFSGSSNPCEAFCARLCDEMLTNHEEKYGYKIPVSVSNPSDKLTGSFWTEGQTDTFNPDNITVSADASDCFFISWSLNPSDSVLLNNQQLFQDFSDNNGVYPYGGYISAVKALCKKPLLIDKAGYSTAANAYEKDTSVNGLDESTQGESIVRALRASSEQGYIGTLIADLNDSWTACSDEWQSFTQPAQDNGLWHNLADPAQTSGVVAVDANTPEEIAMELDNNDKLKQAQFSLNEEYLYLTLLLQENVNYDSNELVVGFDTYQRNNGEYFYDSKYFANSLSGMEFVIKFESKSAAALYVCTSYNRNVGNYESAESYTASYDLVAVLNYGDFTESNTQFYQTGSSIKLRLPWSLLNFTDPSSKLVINGTENGIAKTTATDGIIFSMLIADKGNSDTAYIFPESKEQAGFKALRFSGWAREEIKYSLREKASVSIIKRYFASLG